MLFIFTSIRNIQKPSLQKSPQLWAEEILKHSQAENYGTSFYTEASLNPRKARAAMRWRTTFPVCYWPLLNWLRVIQRVTGCSGVLLAKCCWIHDRGGIIFAIGHALDKQFWTSLWITRALVTELPQAAPDAHSRPKLCFFRAISEPFS